MTGDLHTCKGADCWRELMPKAKWPTSKATRKAHRAAGVYPHIGRGLCAACYYGHQSAGTLDDFPLTPHRRPELLEDWAVVRIAGLPLRTQCKLAAPRMGMTWVALERALLRAGVRSDFTLGGADRKDGCTA